MREILFRGKNIDNGEWVYGYFFESQVDYENRTGYFIISVDSFVGKPLIYEVIPETVGQFTGLTDKTGKKIFEGDIVGGYWKTNIIVYWDDCCLQFRAKEKNNDCDNDIGYYCGYSGFWDAKLDSEVISNIYDNPELLKKE